MSYIRKHTLQKQKELIVVPSSFFIHEDYLESRTVEEIRNAFQQGYCLFNDMMGAIAENPKEYGYEEYDEADYHYASTEAKKSRLAPYDPQYLLFYLCLSGRIVEDNLVVDVKKFRELNQVKKTHNIFMLLERHGFEFIELSNYKIKRGTESLTISYPSNKLMLNLLHMIAHKVNNTVDLKGFSHYDNQFLSWSYRILGESINTNSSNDMVYYISDRLLDESDKEVAVQFHNTLKKLGFYHQRCSWNEGPHISYYRNEKQMLKRGPYQIRLFSSHGKLVTYLRIRNPEACFDYLQNLPDSVKDNFRESDKHCKGRVDGTCKTGVEFEYEGKTVWKCGCWKGSIALYPEVDQIEHYIKLQELGEKKR